MCDTKSVFDCILSTCVVVFVVFERKMKKSAVEIIVGTYQELIVGYYMVKTGEEDYILKQSFTNHSHCASIRSMASRGSHVASGGADETIRVLDLRSRVEAGAIMEHEGSINCLAFYDDHHLFSCSDDKSICIWKTRNWNRLKTLKGHKSSVLSLSVHPSGRLAISLAKDRTLITWNLVSGRKAFYTTLKDAADIVQWSPDGTVYAVVSGNSVDVYSVETAGVTHSIDFGHRVGAIAFVSDTIIAVGGDSGNIEIHAVNEAAILSILPTLTGRVKALDCITSPEWEEEKWLVASSSDGFIKVWRLNVQNLTEENPKLLTQVDTGCRITCQTIVTNVDSRKRTQEAPRNEGGDKLRDVPKSPSGKKKKTKSSKRIKTAE